MLILLTQSGSQRKILFDTENGQNLVLSTIFSQNESKWVHIFISKGSTLSGKSVGKLLNLARIGNACRIGL